MKKGFIEKDKRKKILLISDDIQAHSGVGTVAKEVILNTCHHYNFICLGGAVQHPNVGKTIDYSKFIAEESGVEDCSVVNFCVNGYGDQGLIRNILKTEKPDAIFIITDPRYYIWLFEIENEIRKQCPIIYLNIWDSTPIPYYNLPYYVSCDMLLGISKQTYNINKQVLKKVDDIEIIEL